MNNMMKGLAFIGAFCGIIAICMVGTILAYNKANEGNYSASTAPFASPQVVKQNQKALQILLTDRYI